MNTQVIATQFKRELWENKVSFLMAPALITLLVLLMAICASFYAGSVIHKNGVYFSTTIGGKPSEVGVRTADEVDGASIGAWEAPEPLRKFDAVTSVLGDSAAFDGMVSGAMYTNCILLYLMFSVVISTYALRCLFDDRKNRDILFWRSMPVSETTGTLVKLAMILLIMPVIMLVLNVVITLLSIVLGLIFFSFFGVSPGVLLMSIFNGQSLYLPLQICYELMFALLMLLPIFGFALLASAWAKRSPFFLFASPVVLILVDLLLYKFYGLSIGIMDFFLLYAQAIAKARAAFVLQEAFVFDSSMILPLVTCLAVGSAFIAGAIWLRNNRYEI